MVRQERRLACLFFFFLAAFLFLMGKIAYLQLYKGRELAAAAVQERTIRLPVGNFLRGAILDRMGRTLLDSRICYGVAVFPALLNPFGHSEPASAGDRSGAAAEVCGELFSILPPKYRTPEMVNIFQRALQQGAPFFLPGTVEQEEAAPISRSNIPGVYAVPLVQRYGPNSLARHLVGTVGGSVLSGEVEHGLSGIEAAYDEELAPPETVLNLVALVDGKLKPIPGRDLCISGERGSAVKGKDVVLTLDRRVQEVVERVMDERVVKGAVAVVDVRSGEILAAASRPGYDQKTLVGDQFDRCFSLQHPGSVFKIVVAAAALAEGVVRPEELFHCKGEYSFEQGGGISCWKQDGHGNLSFREAFACSCNPVFVEVALRLGRQKLEYYSRLLGLEERIAGYPPGDWRGGEVRIGSFPGDLGNAALGQDGVRIAPVNLAALAATVARGGVYIRPSLVKGIGDFKGGDFRAIEGPPARRVLPQAVAGELQGMMELAVNSGTGSEAQLPGIGCAGKTGSAETGKVDRQGRPIVDAWFVGYAPVDVPQVAVAVFVEGGGSGGNCAARIFREIIDALHRV